MVNSNQITNTGIKTFLSLSLLVTLNGLPVHAEESSENDSFSVTEEYLPVSSTHRPGVKMTPEYITVHNTANPSQGADALMHSNYLMNGKTHETYLSWHFTVDDKQAIQHIPIDEVAYHAGDSLGAGNMASIGIEICENVDGSYRKAEENAEDLIAGLLLDLNLDISRVVPHQHWSGKYCPHNLLSADNGSVGWDVFIQNIQQKLNQKKAEKEQSNSEDDTAISVPSVPIIQSGEIVSIQEPLVMKQGETDSLFVYKPKEKGVYAITDDGKDAIVEQTLASNEEVLNSHSSLKYIQTVKLIHSTFEIGDEESVFHTLMANPSVKISGDSQFFDESTRSFLTDGISTLRFETDMGTCIFSVFNHIENDPIITSSAEATNKNWNLLSAVSDLTTVMSGASREETKKAENIVSSMTDTRNLIALMQAGKEKKSSSENFSEQKKTPQEDDLKLSFSSSDMSVVRTTSDGQIIAANQGKCTISTTINGIRMERQVVVE